MTTTKIYEIKTNAVENSKKLFSSDENYFYWNNAKFLNNKVGDFIFIINRYNRWALFTSIHKLDIPALINHDKKEATFTDEGISYTVNDPREEFDNFIKFKIHERVEIPDSWKWTTQLGQSQTYDLWKDKIKVHPGRVEKIDDLEKIFKKGDAFNTLEEVSELLKSQTSILGDLDTDIIKILENKDIKKILESQEFFFEKARVLISEFDSLNFDSKTYIELQNIYNTGSNFYDFTNEFPRDSYKYKICSLIGRIISYLDVHADHKNLLNEYDDKRTLAKAMVRMNAWVINLLQYKIDQNSTHGINGPNIINAINYIKYPKDNFTILSDRHREKLSQFLFKMPYSSETFYNEMLNFFKPFSIVPKNTENYTRVLSSIFYYEPLKSKWLLNDSEKKSENTMQPKELINHVYKYIRKLGFTYTYEEIANFFLSIKTKPFVILAGISGTGKTQLPRKFAEALGFSEEQVIQIPVRPDWTDSSDLLGYTSLDGNFVPKDLTIAIQKAISNTEKPYFFILDEMNLARVEHYFSDFLSVIETRKRVGNIIKTDPILREDMIKTIKNKDKFAAFGWPQNLYLIGTVNMDETTHTFSRKVLDRANSIEMNEVNLNWIDTSGDQINGLDNISNELFKTPYINSAELSESDKKSISEEIHMLRKINEILQKADLHFAYRVRDEIAFYLLLNKKYDLISNDMAFDFQLVQKILPRIHGSSERVQVVLVELLNLFEGKVFRSESFEFSSLDGNIDTKNLKYKRASSKIIFMLKRFNDDRFTSFWI